MADAPKEPTRSDHVDITIVLGTCLEDLLKARIQTAVEMFHRGETEYLLLSGRGRGSIPEAQAMRDYSVQKGVDERRIFLECRSADTIENARYSKTLIHC